MTAGDRAANETLALERREADRGYNDALTALDAAIVAAGGRDLTRADFERLATALIVFLQHITSFVESKDRELAGNIASRLETVEQSLGSIGDLRTQLGVLRRATEGIQRALASRQATASTSEPASTAPATQIARDGDYKYVGFEDQFRGPDELIETWQRAYLPLFEGRSRILDVGCGRGEFLAVLKGAGISARGIDSNGDMAAVAVERGLDAAHADALTYLSALPDASLGGLIAAQVVEHLEPPYLIRLLEVAAHKLETGAPIVIETINAASWLAFFSSYLRDFTHVRPVHPDTLEYLVRASGFERVEVRYSAPVPADVKMKTIDLPAATLQATDATSVALVTITHAINRNSVILNNLMFADLDYAVVGYRI